MSQRQSTCKRTRSAKGLAFDQQRGKSLSPEPKERKVNKREKSKTSRRIVFNEEVNSNSNAASLVGNKTARTNLADKAKTDLVEKNTAVPVVKANVSHCNTKKKLLHPCFENVWRKEQLALKKHRLKENESNDNSVLQESQGDGIHLDVEADFVDLDYIDDVPEGEGLSDMEDLDQIQMQQSKNPGNAEMQGSLSGVTKVTGSKSTRGEQQKDMSTVVTHSELNQSNPTPSTSTQGNPVEKLTDEQLASLPRVKNLFNQFWEEKMKEMNGKGKMLSKVQNGHNMLSDHLVKSPSDTTIYAPALVRSSPQRSGHRNEVQIEPRVVDHNGEKIPSRVADVNDMISEFVDNVRLEQQSNRQEQLLALQESERRRASEDNTGISLLDQARERGDKAQLEVEKFRATVAASKPGIDLNLQQFPNIGGGVSDDDFFHMTCHIDPNLIHKIEKGEFVELEKLIPKEKFQQGEDNRLEWVQRDGGTFLVPAQSGTKIGSFRKWEQAFRAYATIYCGANPHRSKEIWQYISVINTAASSFMWDNVYNYDITFRHLMAFNPQRSWSVCYHQMWNLSMRDPLPKNINSKFGGNSFQYHGNGSNGNRNNANNNNANNKKKPDYCWNFNKEVPCKFGARCKYIERCKYCDSGNHGVINCPKLKQKQNSKPVQETKKNDKSN